MPQLQTPDRALLIEKWSDVMDLEKYNDVPLTDYYRRGVVAQLLENAADNPGDCDMSGKDIVPTMLAESVPVNAGQGGGAEIGGFTSGGGTNTGGIASYDPVVINMIRRSAPVNMGFDFCGVQPLNQPVGLIFALKARYDDQAGDEALFNEALSGHSGDDAAQNQLGAQNGDAAAYAADWTTAITHGAGMTTAEMEHLGSEDSADIGWKEMAFTIEKTGVEAKGRALKTGWTLELAQDLKNVHGMEAENVISEILTTEIVAETNREIVRTLYRTAKRGSQINVTTPGTFDLDTDANGRWSVEKFKGLIFQIEREANRVGQETRRGRGNFVICSADVASALQMTGMLDYTPALAGNGGLNVDDTGSTFAGILCGRYKVFIDPYAANMATSQFFVVGYRGSNAIDAGLFYCPYIPLQMVRAVEPKTFQPRIGFKTRYGLVANPFIELDDGDAGTNNLSSGKNYYYRLSRVLNLL